MRGAGGGEGGGQAESTRCFPQFCDTTPYSGSALRFHARSCKGPPPGLLLAKIERTRSTPAESAPFVHARRSTAHARSRVEHSRVQNWWFTWVGGRAPADARARMRARPCGNGPARARRAHTATRDIGEPTPSHTRTNVYAKGRVAQPFGVTARSLHITKKIKSSFIQSGGGETPMIFFSPLAGLGVLIRN